MVVSLVFVVLGPRPGLEIVSPMAVVLVGGLVTTTVVTLGVLPVLYLRFGAHQPALSPEEQTLERWAQFGPEPATAEARTTLVSALLPEPPAAEPAERRPLATRLRRRAATGRPRKTRTMAPSRASRRHSPGATPLCAGLAVLSPSSASRRAEVPSNLVEDQPANWSRSRDRSPARKAPGRDRGENRSPDGECAPGRPRTAVPHAALIYNPDGDVFVYTRPAPQTYVRAPVTVRRVEGAQALLSDGPPAGTVVVTVGAAELLATEYEILNQHP